MPSFERRMTTLVRKSDSKEFVAEVREYPNRFTENLSDTTIAVSYMDASLVKQSTTMTYNGDDGNPWDWVNDEFTCRFVIPEADQEVAVQAPRSVSPIAVKGASVAIISSK
jgi:hypothetical protein